jgi:hypothetical protein
VIAEQHAQGIKNRKPKSIKILFPENKHCADQVDTENNYALQVNDENLTAQRCC